MLTKRKLAMAVEAEASADPASGEEERGDRVICLVPEDVPAPIIEHLERHFPRTGIEVRVTVGRRRERRAGQDRRHLALASPKVSDRRFAPDLEARRFAERRGDFQQVEAPILPAVALPYADKLRFVRRRPRPQGDAELSRVRRLAEAWRDRAKEHENEATGLVRSLVGVVEDLRQMRSMSPRWFLAVRRGDQAIAEYRERHLAG